MIKRKNFGFTLIELLVVISIIGVLAALIMANFNAARERARDAQRKSDLKQIKTALRLYYNDHNLYPLDDGSNNIMGCGADGDALCNWNVVWQAGSSMVYMKILPQDIQYDSGTGTPTYQYTQAASGQDFCLWATLENEADGEITSSQTRCSSTCGAVGPADYIVCAD